MNNFMDGFQRGYTAQTLRDNARDIEILRNALAERDADLSAKRNRLLELLGKVKTLKMSLRKDHCHIKASEAHAKYLMALLDDVHGVENNPARQVAFPGHNCIVPSGKRKGETINKADEVYLQRFKDVYLEECEKSPEDKPIGWVGFLHSYINY